MTIRTPHLFIFVLLFVVLLAACAPPAPPAAPATKPTPTSPPEPTQIKLGVGFIPSVQFAPLYVAIDKGFFADENIALEMEYGFETDFLKLVGTNERQFIIASGEQMILGAAQELPVVYVANWFPRFPVVVFAPQSSGISKPEDLEGKKVGIPGLFGASYVAWKGLIYATGVDEEAITLESIGFTQAAAVQEGLVDAAVDYIVNGPVQMRLSGQEVNIIVIDDYLKLPANGLVTNQQTITENRELVQGMVRAFLRGLRYTLDNPDEAFEISLKFVPEAAQEREVNRAIFDASIELWTPPKGRGLGYTDPDIWPQTATFMFEAGLVDKLVETNGLWTNEFVETAGID
ncbi:MAG: ABC transporter substrate-binding protein [Chloroflexi bacterium]|nr:ABC transporter substrate-binding protein [Chloroflexota bacterium]